MPNINLILDSAGAFLRVGRIETYARRDRTGAPSWGIFREPGSWEMDAGRFRLTVSWVPVGAGGVIGAEG